MPYTTILSNILCRYRDKSRIVIELKEARARGGGRRVLASRKMQERSAAKCVKSLMSEKKKV